MVIKEIIKAEFEVQNSSQKLFEEKPYYNFYKIVFQNSREYFFSTGYNQSSFISLQINSDLLLCAGNTISLFSSEGNLLLFLRLFEPIKNVIQIVDSIYLFSERISYQFSLENYSISEMKWYSDVITNIDVENNAILIKCFDKSTYLLK